ncbi:MAG: polysaccharide biosynthesis protein [Clostridiaceae bacterium]|nr:polysaccharide biosynthesis protein [Clostridiaceae bacterium]
MEKQSSSKGFTILSAASIITKLLGVLYVPIYTLILGNYGNGIYEQGFKIYQLVFVIANTGMPIALSKIISEQLASEKYLLSYRTLRISTVMLTVAGLVTSVSMALLAMPLANMMYSPEAYLTILALSPAMIFTAIGCIYRGYFQGRSNMVPTSISQIIEQAVNCALTILFAWVMYKYGVNVAAVKGITDQEEIFKVAAVYAAAGATIGTTAGAMASTLYLLRTYHKNRNDILKEIKLTEVSGQRASNKEIVKKILSYAIPVTLGSVLIYATQIIDVMNIKTRLMTAGFTDFEATSMYGILSTQYNKVLFIPVAFATALQTAILPSISAAHALNDRALLHRRIYRSFKTILMIVVPAAIGIAVMAKPIINILFPRYPDGWDLLMIGSWTLVLISLVSIQTSILQGIGKVYVPTIHMIIGLVLKLIVNYTLIAVKPINIKGAIIGNAVCYIFAAFMNYRAIKRHTGVRLSVKRLFNRPLSVSVIMGLIVYLVYHGSTLMAGWLIKSLFIQNLICSCFAIAAGMLVYYLLMIMAKGLTADDIRSFPMGGRILDFTARVPIVDRYLKL